MAPALHHTQSPSRAAVLLLYPGQPDNLAAFELGEGHGTYATYVGLRADSHPVHFVTGFLDVDNPWDD